MPHPSNLPEEDITPQVWFGNWYRTSISEFDPPIESANFIPPTGGSPLFVEAILSEQWYSVIMPGPATFVRMSGYRVFSSGGDHEGLPSCDFHLRVNGVVKAILAKENNSVNFTIKVQKGDLISVQIKDVIGDSVLVSVGLLFIPDIPNYFYYCGGSGGVNIIQAGNGSPSDPLTFTHWVRRPAFNWRDFVLSDALFSESNTPARARSIVSTKCMLISCLVRIHNSNTFAIGGGSIGPFQGTCNIILIKGRGISEEVIGEGQIINNGETEIIVNAALEPGDLVSFAIQVQGSSEFNDPGIYWGCVVKSKEPGWFMLGNGHEFAPNDQGSVYPLTDAEEESNIDDEQLNGSISPVNMQFKNWHLGIKNMERGPAVYQMYINHEPSNLTMSITEGMQQTSDLQNLDIVRSGDIIYYTGQGDVNFFSNGFTHALSAKVILPPDIVNHPRGRLPGAGNQRNLRQRSIIDRL